MVSAEDKMRRPAEPVSTKTSLMVWQFEALPGKAPFSKRFENAVGQACEIAPVRRVARQFALPESGPSICGIWSVGQRRRKTALRQLGVAECIWAKARSL